MVGQFADTDTASTERLHSENQRRGKFRVWTHPSDLCSLSTWFIARSQYRQAAELQRGCSDAVKKQAIENVAASAAGPVVLPESKKPRRGGGGAWRAFCKIHATGVKLTGDVASRLSAQYRALTPEEKQKYIDLGELGTTIHAEGGRSFGPRDRTREQYGHSSMASALGASPDGAGAGDLQKITHELLFQITQFSDLVGNHGWEGVEGEGVSFPDE